MLVTSTARPVWYQPVPAIGLTSGLTRPPSTGVGDDSISAEELAQHGVTPGTHERVMLEPARAGKRSPENLLAGQIDVDPVSGSAPATASADTRDVRSPYPLVVDRDDLAGGCHRCLRE